MDDTRRQGEDDRDRRDARGVGPRDECPSSVLLDVRCIDDDEPAGGKATNDLAMEDRERGSGPALIGLIPAEKRAVRVRGQHVAPSEVAGRER